MVSPCSRCGHVSSELSPARIPGYARKLCPRCGHAELIRIKLIQLSGQDAEVFQQLEQFIRSQGSAKLQVVQDPCPICSRPVLEPPSVLIALADRNRRITIRVAHLECGERAGLLVLSSTQAE